MARLDPHTGAGYAVGITGPPGVGKSTLVDRLAEHLRGEGKTVGILAVDPTSPFTGGALLGDRIRMQRHYLDDGVFIRSVATRGQSGGLPRIVKSMVRALDAAGKDVTLVETVGVGQTELGIMGVADTVVVAMTPESGDSIQTLKAGVMEIADLYVINKADRDGANRLSAAVTAMLQMSDLGDGWNPPVLLTQAYANVGIGELWDSVGCAPRVHGRHGRAGKATCRTATHGVPRNGTGGTVPADHGAVGRGRGVRRVIEADRRPVRGALWGGDDDAGGRWYWFRTVCQRNGPSLKIWQPQIPQTNGATAVVAPLILPTIGVPISCGFRCPPRFRCPYCPGCCRWGRCRADSCRPCPGRGTAWR